MGQHRIDHQCHHCRSLCQLPEPRRHLLCRRCLNQHLSNRICRLHLNQLSIPGRPEFHHHRNQHLQNPVFRLRQYPGCRLLRMHRQYHRRLHHHRWFDRHHRDHQCHLHLSRCPIRVLQHHRLYRHCRNRYPGSLA